MNEKSLIPSIRFAGFTDAWERRKLGELGHVSMCKRIFKEQTAEEGEVPFYKIGTFGGQPDAFISRSLFEEFKTKYPYPQKGDILISASGSIGRTVEYSGNDEYFQDSNIVWFHHDDSIQNCFLKHFYLVVEWAGLEGSTIKRLYNETILGTLIVYPSPYEQQLIGEFFSAFDRLIALHQSKYEKLLNIKKSMLDKMFPKNGELFPDVRFAGFTDAWERRKLGEVAEFNKGAGYSKADIQPEGTPLILYGRLYTKYQTIIREIDTFAVPKSGSMYSKGGEVVVPASGETAEDISIASVVAKSGVMIGGDLNIVLPYQVLDPAFLAYSITYAEPHFKLSQYAQGKSVVHIHNADIKAVDIPFPKIQEQESICRLLDIFDRLITLHQRKLEKLQNIKKACLEKMFV